MQENKHRINPARTVKWYGLADEDLFPLQEGKRVRFEEYDVMIFNLGPGMVRALDNKCPRGKERLEKGMVAAGYVFCPRHSLKISLETGCVEHGDGQVKVYPARVWQAMVYVAFEEGRYLGKTEISSLDYQGTAMPKGGRL